MKISFFRPRGKYAWLSNFSPHGFELDGKYWPTVEHYFQAAKFFKTAPEHAEMIRLCRSPARAKKLGRARDVPLQPGWGKVRLDVMRRAVMRKFESHRDLHDALIATGSAELVEQSPSDEFWGIGASSTGKNMAGVILMEVRARLMQAMMAEDRI